MPQDRSSYFVYVTLAVWRHLKFQTATTNRSKQQNKEQADTKSNELT